MTVSAVVLAAGESTRMGTQKLFLPFGSKSVVRTVVDTLCLGGVDDVVVVTGFESARLRAHLADADVRFVHNRRYRSADMHTSIRCGFRAVADARMCLLMPGDLPVVQKETIRSLIDSFDPKEGLAVLVPVCGEKRGHPVLLSWKFRSTVLKSREKMALKKLTATGMPGVKLLEVNDPGIHLDLDSPEDYKHILEQLPR